MSVKEELKKDVEIVSSELKGKDNYLTSSVVLAGVATLIVVIVLVYQFLTINSSFKKAMDYLNFQFKSDQAITQTLSPTPTPIPLSRGSREFGVSGGDNPYITGLKFSEFSPKIGEKQTITVSVSDEKGGKVLGVEIVLKTDKKTKTYPLKLTSGTDKKGDWSVTLTAEDTINYVYGMDIKAKNDKGQVNQVKPIFR